MSTKIQKHELSFCVICSNENMSYTIFYTKNTSYVRIYVMGSDSQFLYMKTYTYKRNKLYIYIVMTKEYNNRRGKVHSDVLGKPKRKKDGWRIGY